MYIKQHIKLTCRRGLACCTEMSGMQICESKEAGCMRGVRSPAAQGSLPPAAPRCRLTEDWQASVFEHTPAACRQRQSPQTMDLLRKKWVIYLLFQGKKTLTVIDITIVSQCFTQVIFWRMTGHFLPDRYYKGAGTTSARSLQRMTQPFVFSHTNPL